MKNIFKNQVVVFVITLFIVYILLTLITYIGGVMNDGTFDFRQFSLETKNDCSVIRNIGTIIIMFLYILIG